MTSDTDPITIKDAAQHFGWTVSTLWAEHGCGCPEDAYNFCRDVLSCFDRRGDGQWVMAEDAVAAIIKERPDDAAHVISHLLTHLKLLEHGGSVGGSWLTDDGARIIDLGPMTEEKMEEGR